MKQFALYHGMNAWAGLGVPNWLSDPNPIAITNGVAYVTEAASANAAFYRLLLP
jgi:hypothetical protein